MPAVSFGSMVRGFSEGLQGMCFFFFFILVQCLSIDFYFLIIIPQNREIFLFAIEYVAPHISINFQAHSITSDHSKANMVIFSKSTDLPLL